MLQSSPTRVFLVVSRQLVVEALTHVLATDPEIVVIGHASSLEAQELRSQRPGVIVVDIDDRSGTVEEAIDACGRHSPQSRIVILSAQRRVRVMQRALSAKADAYVLKDTSPTMMREVIHTVARGEYFADPGLAAQLLRRRTSRAKEETELSSRESEIVRLISEGLSNREIGVRLLLSEKTVKNHVSHILTKLKVTARSGVAVYAVRNGLVS